MNKVDSCYSNQLPLCHVDTEKDQFKTKINKTINGVVVGALSVTIVLALTKLSLMGRRIEEINLAMAGLQKAASERESCLENCPSYAECVNDFLKVSSISRDEKEMDLFNCLNSEWRCGNSVQQKLLQAGITTF